MYVKSFFKDKKITVIGLGLLGGVSEIKFLAEMGADLIVTDLKSKKELKSSLDILKKFKNIKYTIAHHDFKDFQNRDLIVKAPTTPLESPYIALARKNGIPVVMWAALFSKFAKESGAKIVGVTGTRGKTTTTEMIAHIIRKAHKRIILGGNIKGSSLFANLSKITKDAIVVLELDSWKLQGFGDLKISPDISVFVTFFPDHMNYYGGNMKKYFDDKANIFKHHKKGDVLIVGSQVLPFMKKWAPKITNSILIQDGRISKNLKLQIPGEHNLYNASLASIVARKLGFKDAFIKKSLEDFKGVPGRLEFIRELKGVKYYNDTTATTPEATIAALSALGKNRNLILIAGGADKELKMGTLVKEMKRYCKKVLLLSGTGTNNIKDKVKNAIVIDSLKRAVHKARYISKPGDTVILSPAFASFGMFKNEYDRGDQFIKIVKGLR